VERKGERRGEKLSPADVYVALVDDVRLARLGGDEALVDPEAPADGRVVEGVRGNHHGRGGAREEGDQEREELHSCLFCFVCSF
jgi:hypothetical protein